MIFARYKPVGMARMFGASLTTGFHPSRNVLRLAGSPWQSGRPRGLARL